MTFTRKQKKYIRKVTWVLFIIYMMIMAYFLFFSEGLNRSDVGSVYRYNLTLFQEIKRGFWCLRHGSFQYFFLNVVLNVAAFAPFGFILPIISPKNRKFIHIFLLSLELTLTIEILQLVFKVGIFDVDDIFLNTVGGTLGYIAFSICGLFIKPSKKER
ncbi:VanZ family protein [Velocimicrobium porci]|nr:VanZ family protein [Velocimicrobium porci]